MEKPRALNPEPYALLLLQAFRLLEKLVVNGLGVGIPVVLEGGRKSYRSKCMVLGFQLMNIP